MKSTFFDSNAAEMKLTRQWADPFPTVQGIQLLFEDGKLVYVGESGSFSGRLTDISIQHHTVRRAFG